MSTLIMWKTLGNIIRPALQAQQTLLKSENILQQQLRTTYILKRRHPTQLHSKGTKPKSLRSRHYIYDLVKVQAMEKKQDINVILTTYIEGLGNTGQIVAVRPDYAYNNLLLPGLAVYASPENLEKYKGLTGDVTEEKHSSATSSLTIKTLSSIVLSVVMNMEQPWTIQPWHIKTSFRKCGYVVPEASIQLPEEPIKGPDMSLEDKEFYVTVSINNTEKVNVRCRIHHWSTDIINRIPYRQDFWKLPTEPIFFEHKTILDQLPSKYSKKVEPGK